MTTWKMSGYPISISEFAITSGITRECAMAITSTVRATTNPAMGPAIPMSNNAQRERMGDRMRITAP